MPSHYLITFKKSLMKKFKVSIFAVIAIVMGIAASAFTAPNSNALRKTTENTYWFLMDANGHVTTTQVTDPLATYAPTKSPRIVQGNIMKARQKLSVV